MSGLNANINSLSTQSMLSNNHNNNTSTFNSKSTSITLLGLVNGHTTSISNLISTFVNQFFVINPTGGALVV